MTSAYRIKVMIVEDSATMRMVLARKIRDDYHVTEAEDGQAAVELMAVDRPDVLLLDLHMPRLDGFGVINHVRRELADEDLFILILTAESDLDLRAQALHEGANDFLVKPVDWTEFMARMAVAERQVQLTRQLRFYLDKITREVDQIARLQRRLLPEPRPAFGFLTVEQFYRPSGLGSGDYLDHFPLDEHRLRLILADVSGHGARAAFLTAIVRTLARSSRTHGQSLVELAETINDHLLETLAGEGDFVTLAAVDIDLKERSLSCINAGHCPIMLLKPDDTVLRIDPQGPPLGFFPLQFQCDSACFSEQCRLFLFTDGFYEWASEDRRPMDLEEFWTLSANLLASRGDFLNQLMRRLECRDPQPQFTDDCTAILVGTEAVE